MESYLPGLARSTLIYLHVVLVVLAGVAIAFGDFAIFGGDTIDRLLLAKAGRAVTIALVALWLTGLGIVAFDVATAGVASALGDKLRAKFCVVAGLSLNGWLMHRFCFDRLGVHSAVLSESDARRAALFGAVSSASWAYALFLGVAKGWVPLLGYSGFMVLYAVTLALAAGIALRWVAPFLMARPGPRPAAMAALLGLAPVRVVPRNARRRRGRIRR